MIIILLINFVLLFIGSVFSFLPPVDKFPSVFGFDIDGALVTGMGYFNTFIQAVWPIKYVFYGFLVIMGYYSIKIGVKFFFGSRTPGN